MRPGRFFFSEIKNTQAFFALFFFYCLGMLSILRADRLYLDDMGRALYAYADWAPAGRPMAELLSWIFFLGVGTVDASPVTQILAAAELALAALLLCRALGFGFSPFVLAACIPIGLSPYGLENLSYKFDAPFMALSQLLCVLPFLCLRRGGRAGGKGFFPISVLCLFSSASIYQAGMNLYPAVALFICLRAFIAGAGGKGFARLILRFALPFSLAALGYALQVSCWLTGEQYGDYVARHCAIPSFWRLPGKMFANTGDYLSLLYGDWGENSLGALLLLLFFCFCAVFLRRAARGRGCSAISGGRSTARGLMGRCSVILALIFCFLLSPLGVQAPLEFPVWSPRTFCAFGTVLALMLLSLHPGRKSGNCAKISAGFLAGFVSLQLLLFASLYGNMLSVQNDWEDLQLARLAPVIWAFKEEKGLDRVIFTNSAGYSPLMSGIGRRFPLIRRMTVVPLTRNMRWGYEQLKIYGAAVRAGKPLPEDAQLVLYKDTPYFRLEECPGAAAVVTFKNIE
ncbi:MAG: glucosyltransferase domain-containing protein [Desulfovibrio sp.]|jgi:hypothetical protein|nr:glucosyltransferase domain-containing protein [Desulfovibrio sp.]